MQQSVCEFVKDPSSKLTKVYRCCHPIMHWRRQLFSTDTVAFDVCDLVGTGLVIFVVQEA